MVTLVATVWIAQWSQNKRFYDLKSDMNRHFDDVIRRLDRIEKKLDDHEERIVGWKNALHLCGADPLSP